jgi:Kef-type K+ transport system membrane component KefB
VGIAMSITAFPVLARIVQERGIHKTRLGAIVITVPLLMILLRGA